MLWAGWLNNGWYSEPVLPLSHESGSPDSPKKKVCLSESRLEYDVGYGEQINQVNKKQ